MEYFNVRHIHPIVKSHTFEMIPSIDMFFSSIIPMNLESISVVLGTRSGSLTNSVCVRKTSITKLGYQAWMELLDWSY